MVIISEKALMMRHSGSATVKISVEVPQKADSLPYHLVNTQGNSVTFYRVTCFPMLVNTPHNRKNMETD